MDHNSSNSQIDQYSIDEFSQFYSVPCQLQAIPQDKDLLKTPSEDGSDLTNKTQNSQQRKSSIAFRVKDENPNDGKKRKMIIHREIERQRRQEMATLYKSLRSLLPLEYLKGKRSISDQIQQAVNYIKHLEHNIEELSDKTDKLKKLSINPKSSSSALETLESSKSLDTLTVEPCLVGVEVVINTNYAKAIPLSRVVKVMVEEGLSVLSCISKKANERMLHIIKLEVNDGRSINVLELQQKLKNSIF